MPRWVKVCCWVAGALVVVLIAGLVTVVWTVHRSFPQTSGRIDVPGLEYQVTVRRDASGIPQVYAQTSDDLFFAQGYVQAQDRFFQMDFWRHLTSGTLSSLFGSSALKTDELVRTLGWRRVAERELPLLSAQTRGYLQAYANGVNAYLADHQGSRLSLEYAALGLAGVDDTPAPWEPVDSLAWLKAMAWDLGSNMQDEIDRSLESTRLTREQIAELYPPYPYAAHQPIVNQGAVVDGVYEQNATRSGSRQPPSPPAPARAFDGPLASAGRQAASLTAALGGGGSDEGIGSNAWAVSGAHTASGKPILANDPHLEASMPGIWYEMGLHCAPVSAQCPFDVSGFTFPGMPGVVIGHNASIAWGFTNLYPDTEDLYLEKVEGDDYLYDGHWIAMRTRRETIQVRGAKAVTILVRTTRDGPIISGVDTAAARAGRSAPAPAGSPGRGVGYQVALRWTALTPGRTADAIFGIDKARDWNEFHVAARSFAAPSQNMVYADVHGNIGYQAPGVIPIRRAGNGNWPVPGWNPAYQWDRFSVPYEALPNVLDPKSGYIVTANQAVVGPSYPYDIGDSYDYGFRSERILDLLKATPKLTVGDMARIQHDTYSQLAHDLVPYLLKIRLPTPYYRRAQALFRGWNDRMDADSSAAAYFAAVWKDLLALTFHDQLPKEAWPTGDDRWWQVVEDLVKQPDNTFWDDVHTPKRETMDDILRESLEDARNDLTQLRSSVPQQWQWGNLHQLNLRNQTLGTSSVVGFLFNRGPYDVSGAGSVVDATSFDASKGFDATVVPSMRMIIPLADLDHARWIQLTGESGHAYDSHYTDQTSLWLKGQTLPWAFTARAVEASTVDTLILLPRDTGPPG